MRYPARRYPLLSLLLIGSSLWAADLWVSPTGVAGNPGTFSEPRDLASAATGAVAGTVVRLKAGIYAQRLVIAVSGNSISGPIVFRGEPGAVLDGASVAIPPDDWVGLVEIDGRSWIRIENLEVRNWKTTSATRNPVGILVRSAGGATGHIAIVGNHVHDIWQSNKDSGAHGIAVYGNHTTPITDLTIAGNEIDHCRLAWSESLVINGNVDGFEVSGNRIHHNNNIGIDIIGWEGEGPVDDQARNGQVWGNTVWNIHTDGYGDAGSANSAYASSDDSAGGIYVDGGRDILIERNLIYDCDICLEIGAEHKPLPGPAGSTIERNSQRITVRNNLAHTAKQGVLMFGGYSANLGWAEDCVFTGNTFYNADLNGWDVGVIVVQKSKNCSLRNNLVVATGSAGLVLSSGIEAGPANQGNVLDWNLYWSTSGTPGYQIAKGPVRSGLAAYQVATGQDGHAIEADPGFTSVTGTIDLHLDPGSPAIDRGDPGYHPSAKEKDIDAQIRREGTSVDIGADETVSAGGPHLEAPVITGQPQDRVVIAGGSTTFAVSATGTPSPSYQWQKDGLDIPGAVEAEVTVDSVPLGWDGAFYRCVVSNSQGHVTSRSALVTVVPDSGSGGGSSGGRGSSGGSGCGLGSGFAGVLLCLGAMPWWIAARSGVEIRRADQDAIRTG